MGGSRLSPAFLMISRYTQVEEERSYISEVLWVNSALDRSGGRFFCKIMRRMYGRRMTWRAI